LRQLRRNSITPEEIPSTAFEEVKSLASKLGEACTHPNICPQFPLLIRSICSPVLAADLTALMAYRGDSGCSVRKKTIEGAMISVTAHTIALKFLGMPYFFSFGICITGKNEGFSRVNLKA